MSFRTPGRVAVRHRGVADGVDKVACGKGGAFYAYESGLTKRKPKQGQRLGPFEQRKIRAKRAEARKFLSVGRVLARWRGRPAGSAARGTRFRDMQGDRQLLQLDPLVIGEFTLGHQLVIAADRRL